MSPEVHEPGEGSTPEVVAAYWGSFDATRRTLRTLRRRVGVAVVIVSLFVVTVTAVFLTNQSNQTADINATVNAVRIAQEHNTKTSDQRAACQTQALDDVLKDATLALMGDRNALDYATIPKC